MRVISFTFEYEELNSRECGINLRKLTQRPSDAYLFARRPRIQPHAPG